MDCPHVFCLECLQQWVKKKATIECPECRYITVVPQGGLGNLKTNLRLKNVVEAFVKGKNAKSVEKTTAAPTCPDHDGQQQHFFCVTCRITACHNCLVWKHPRHEIKTLIEMREVEEKNRRKKIRELENFERKVESAKKQAERAVESRAQQMTAEVEAERKEIMRRIQITHQQRMQKIQEEKQNKSAGDTIRIDRLYIAQHDVQQEDIPTLQFNPGSGSLNSSWFGELVTSRNRKLTFVTEYGRFQQVQGVAVTQTGLLAVADPFVKDVSVYRNVNGEYKNQFCLRLRYQPISVAVTSEGKFLVSDNGQVMVFLPSGRYERSWPDSVIADRITTSPDDIIVIGSCSKGIISVYQSNGELIRTHQADCENIADIASNGKQIAFTTGISGKVCVIDFVTGQTLWLLDMVWPFGICYEQRSNTILVAGDSCATTQSMIQQYCSTTGRLISRLASGLYNPLAMTTTQDNKLVVADNKTVKIYNIQ